MRLRVMFEIHGRTNYPLQRVRVKGNAANGKGYLSKYAIHSNIDFAALQEHPTNLVSNPIPIRGSRSRIEVFPKGAAKSALELTDRPPCYALFSAG